MSANETTYEAPVPAKPKPAILAGDMASYAMLICGQVALGIASTQWGMVLPFLVATGLHALLGTQIRRKPGLIFYLLLGLPFAILSRTYEVEGGGVGGPSLNTPFYVALYMNAYALIQMYRPSARSRYPIVLVCSGLSLGCSGADMPSSSIFPALTVAYAVALLVLLRSYLVVHPRVSGPAARRGRGPVAAAFVLVAGLTVAVVLALDAYFLDINAWLMRMAIPAPLATSGGFGDTARIGSISSLRNRAVENAVAIRAFGPIMPGYLRGRVFSVYAGGRWTGGVPGVDLRPDFGKNKDQSTGRVAIPHRPPPGEFDIPLLEIYPERRYRAHFFLPLESTAIETVSTTVNYGAGGVLTSKYTPTSRGYRVHVDPAPVFDHPGEAGTTGQAAVRLIQRAYMRRSPRKALNVEINKVIRSLEPVPGAEKKKPKNFRHVLARWRSHPEASVAALARYFDKHYTYRIGITFKNRKAPVVEWLREKRHGHCELFATAGVLILRRIGIPARYVTGFVCREKNPHGDLWIARNRHAHAWVEYFTPDRGWRTAEFTPGDAQPSDETPEGTNTFLDYLRGLWEKTLGFFIREGVSGVALTVGMLGYWLIETWPRRIFFALLILAFVVYRMIRNRRRARAKEWSPRILPDAIERQRQAFLQLEGELRKKGVPRRPAETLLEYADRIETADLEDRVAVVRFVRAYAAQRYAPFISVAAGSGSA